MPYSPWDYAAKTRTEHAEQVALFMWANMARLVGPNIANDPHAYTVAGFAKTQFEGKGGLGFIRYSEPVAELKWLHAIHNQGVDAGKAGAIRGSRAKAEGVVAGVADVFLPVPMCRVGIVSGALDRTSVLAGFYIELKRKDGGSPSADQLEFQADMRAAGYKAEIIHGWELARDEILRYLGRS